MYVRPLREHLLEQIVAALGISQIYDGEDLEAHNILRAYNAYDPSYKHKLSIVQFGDQFVGVDFDPDKSCWYNPENRYGCQPSFYTATLDAVGTRLHLLDHCAEQIEHQFKKNAK